ncbi:MAG: hypothetical protein M1819_004743 [Sarea resinae]|nr:MAG: hypothetical protein M1819_004743 [Sarea resinae]
MDLSLTTVLPDQILTIPSLFTSTLCKTYVSFLSSLPFITTPARPKKGDAVRVNDRFQIDDPVFAERLWRETGLKDLIVGGSAEGLDGGRDGHGDEAEGGEMSAQERRDLWGGEVVGLNPNIRIYRYRKGQFFAQHYDDSNTLEHSTVAPTSAPPTTPSSAPCGTPAKTTWTLLIYLTSPSTGCEGGETVFYLDDDAAASLAPAAKQKKKMKAVDVKKKEEGGGGGGGGGGGRREEEERGAGPIVVGLETGMALLHRHGRDCLLHEGREVREGEKWVLRSDLCVKR